VKWSDLGKTVAQFAPVAGSLLGGPAGGAIGSLIASSFGVENEPTAIAQAISSDPDAAVKLRQFEMMHKEKLENLKLDTIKTELADKANAREHHKHSKMPAVVTVLLTILVGALLWCIVKENIPDKNIDLAMYMFGQVFTLWGASITYWVGTTRSSAEKDRRTKAIGS